MKMFLCLAITAYMILFVICALTSYNDGMAVGAGLMASALLAAIVKGEK